MCENEGERIWKKMCHRRESIINISKGASEEEIMAILEETENLGYMTSERNP